MLETNEIICGDCLEIMKDIPDKSIDLVLTSPPYDNLRDYHGYKFEFKKIAKELFRIVKDGGVVVWVVGDATINGSETGTSFKQALYFKEIGFNLHDTMIYEKKNPIPQNHNRYDQCFEYMFVFSKNKPKTLNLIKIPTKNAGKIENRSGRSLLDKNQCRRHKGKEWGKIKETKLMKNIFTYTLGQNKNGHPATFPEKLAIDHINSWSNRGDLVLDPMCGSGTTCKVAQFLGRNFIGIEISEKYCEIAKKRLAQKPLF